MFTVIGASHARRRGCRRLGFSSKVKNLIQQISKSGEPDIDEGCRQAKDPKGRWQPKVVNRESLRQEMQAGLVSEPPPSLRSVVIKMNRAQHTGLYYEPDLYHMIVDRRAA